MHSRSTKSSRHTLQRAKERHQALIYPSVVRTDLPLSHLATASNRRSASASVPGPSCRSPRADFTSTIGFHCFGYPKGRERRGHRTTRQNRSSIFLSWAFCKESFAASFRLSCRTSSSNVLTSSENVILGASTSGLPSRAVAATDFLARACRTLGWRFGRPARSSIPVRSARRGERPLSLTASTAMVSFVSLRSFAISLGAASVGRASDKTIGGTTGADDGGGFGVSVAGPLSADLPRDARSSKNFHGVFMMPRHTRARATPSYLGTMG